MPLQKVHCAALLACLALPLAVARRADTQEHRILLHTASGLASGSRAPDMKSIGCGHTFEYPSENSQAVQDFISQHLAPWIEAAGSNQSISSRPEGAAAANVLETVSVDLKVLGMMAMFEGKIFRWAVFSRDDADVLVMQAVAFVQQVGGSITVHGIVSRRSLLDDAAAVSGAGRALIASVLETVHQEDPERALAVVGSPGDGFVDKLYRKHGMEEVGRTQDDSVKLQMDIAAHCVDFVRDVMLCKKVRVGDYGKIMWRLIPWSEKVMETCAHILPVNLYTEQIGKTLGLAQ